MLAEAPSDAPTTVKRVLMLQLVQAPERDPSSTVASALHLTGHGQPQEEVRQLSDAQQADTQLIAAHQHVKSSAACLQGDQGALDKAGQVGIQVLCLHALQAIVRGVLQEAPAHNAPSASALQSTLSLMHPAFTGYRVPSRRRRVSSALCLPAWWVPHSTGDDMRAPAGAVAQKEQLHQTCAGCVSSCDVWQKTSC